MDEKRGGGRSPRGDVHPVISVTQITELFSRRVTSLTDQEALSEYYLRWKFSRNGGCHVQPLNLDPRLRRSFYTRV